MCTRMVSSLSHSTLERGCCVCSPPSLLYDELKMKNVAVLWPKSLFKKLYLWPPTIASHFSFLVFFLEKTFETFMTLLGISLSKSKEEVIEQKLKSRKLLLPTLLLQDAAVREKTSPSLYTRRAFTYFYKVSFFSKDPFFSSASCEPSC